MVPHKSPGWSKDPISAVSDSKAPSKGAIIVSLSISFLAAATPASAD